MLSPYGTAGTSRRLRRRSLNDWFSTYGYRRERIRGRRAWGRVGDRFVMESMAGKETLFGFLGAGAISALVPREVFEIVFPRFGRHVSIGRRHPLRT